MPLADLDKWLNRRPILAANPDQLRSWITENGQRLAPGTTFYGGARILQYLRWCNGDEPVGRTIRKALAKPSPGRVRNIQPLTEGERDALLRAAGDTPHSGKALLWGAILWTFWDTGLRLSELLSLRASGVEFDAQGCRLRLRDGDEGLKTGARTVYAVDCAAPIKVWLGMHPNASNPDAYPSRLQDAHQTFWPNNVSTRLKPLAKRAGGTCTRTYSATHALPGRRKQGGTSPRCAHTLAGAQTATCQAHYIHLAQADQEDLVRRDANVDHVGHSMRQDPTKALAQITGQAVAETLRALGLAPAPTSRRHGNRGPC